MVQITLQVPDAQAILEEFNRLNSYQETTFDYGKPADPPKEVKVSLSLTKKGYTNIAKACFDSLTRAGYTINPPYPPPPAP
jgi:hypothetical protein